MARLYSFVLSSSIFRIILLCPDSAYVNHQTDAIHLAGRPDIPESHPHSKISKVSGLQVLKHLRSGSRSRAVRSQLQNTQAAYIRKVPIIREKSGTPSRQSGHKLKRVWRLDSGCRPQLSRGAQVMARNLCKPDPSTLSQKGFITPRQ
jgi:hypothetical protein